MAINQNHLFEELNGVKCAIVEKNASQERVEFLKNLLEYNGYTVIVADSPAPKAAPVKPSPVAKPAAATEGAQTTPSTDTAAPVAPPTPVAATPGPPPPPPPAPQTYIVGVTNLLFNPTNAIFGRLLRTPDGHVVTLAYWQQKEAVAHDGVPYYESKV
jgi:hypothetical protein